MKKVITYGTYDLLHYGHIRLLERAKALGDYLIVGVTGEDYDKSRGKINVKQSLMERVEAVKATGLADEIIVEEYEGQKIDDIKRYGIDIFTVGSDWVGKFDYLNEYCKVVYLDRTQGVSSSEIRSEQRCVRLGLIGDTHLLKKFINEAKYVNGLKIVGVACTNELCKLDSSISCYNSYDEMLESVDAVYIASLPDFHYEYIKTAINLNKHVLCESPIALNSVQCKELFQLATNKNCILMDGIKTAYSDAYYRLLLLVKSGKIGEVVSIDVSCTSLNELENIDLANKDERNKVWNSICYWGPTALLPIFQILGNNYKDIRIASKCVDNSDFDLFTHINLLYDNAVATVKIGRGVKTEGELIISGTKGYVYVPAPWWKTDYFEIRYENPIDNERYFYHLEGEGIRYEIVSFIKSIEEKNSRAYTDDRLSNSISNIIDRYYKDRILL